MSRTNVRTGRTEQITIYLTPAQRDQLRVMSDARGSYMGQFVYEMVCLILEWIPPAAQPGRPKRPVDNRPKTGD
jgi:hypothetical protein